MKVAAEGGVRRRAKSAGEGHSSTDMPAPEDQALVGLVGRRSHDHPPPRDGAAAPTQQPHDLAGDGLVVYLASDHDIACVRGSGGLLERIPSTLTVVRDLGKRQSAQRLALDT